LGGAALQMQSSSTARCRRFSLGIQRVARFLLTQSAALRDSFLGAAKTQAF